MSTVKYVRREDIVLKTQADCYKALLDGFTLQCFENFIKLVDGYCYNVKGMSRDRSWQFANPQEWAVYEEVLIPWYETATFPVICWVTEKKDYPVMIISYEQKDNLVVFKSEVTEWINAVPVTLEEFKKYNEQYSS